MKLAVIGAGNRLCGMLPSMRKLGVEVAAIADPNAELVRQRLDQLDIPYDQTCFVGDAEALLDRSDEFAGFAIGSRCHLHAPLAIKVAKTGKPLFLEKPVAINQEQLDALADAWRGREDRVVLSFPLRVSPVFQIALDTMRSGRLGVINQVQAVNNVPYGEVYFESWYRRFHEVGGLWLQKATHDFDYLNQLVGARPLRIAAMMTQRIFGTGRVLQPDRPWSPELPHVDENSPAPPPIEEDISDRDADLADAGSRFHAAIRNQDAGSAIIWYDNGVIMSYDQNFVSRRAAGKRGAIVTGYNGTLSWDWSPESKVRIIDHDSPRVDVIECPAEGGHNGGDEALCQSFVDLIHGQPNLAGNLRDGLLSVAMCLAARKAAQNHTVEDIPDMGLFPRAEHTIDPSIIEA